MLGQCLEVRSKSAPDSCLRQDWQRSSRRNLDRLEWVPRARILERVLSGGILWERVVNVSLGNLRVRQSRQCTGMVESSVAPLQDDVMVSQTECPPVQLRKKSSTVK